VEKRYLRRGLALAVTASIALAACTQTPGSSPAPSGSTAASTRGAGGDLKILYWQAVTLLNPHLNQGTKDFDGSRLVIEPLAAMGPNGTTPVAVLASEVPTVANGGISSDFTSVTWKLKPNVKWSDGSAFTSADVLFTWNWVKDPAAATTTASVFDGVKTMTAPDALTVKVTYDAPNPNPYQVWTSYYGGVLQEKQFKDWTGAKAKDAPGNQTPIGTGPYKVKEFKADDVVTYEINENYRDANKPFFKTVTFKGGGDATSAARAVFQTGEYDYGWNLQVEYSILKPMIEASDSKGVSVAQVSSNVERILLNRTNPDPALGAKRAEPDQPHPFLSDLKVRQALAMGIDRTPLTALYGGKTQAGEATCNIVTGVPAYTSTNTASLPICKYDLAAANKLLDEAGWVKGADGIRAKGGKQMSIIYQTTVNALRQKEQDIVKNGWTQLGIKVELKAVVGGTFFSSGESPDTASKFFTDVEMYTNGSESADPSNYLSGWTCAEIKTAALKWAGSNTERWCNKTYDDMFAQYKKEVDPAKRNDLIIKMNDLLVSDVVVIPLVARSSPFSAASKQLKGIVANPWDSEMWNIADWSK
jgi:peptide/nickel transport system substrate-binding protein